jgi:hypothetical protein
MPELNTSQVRILQELANIGGLTRQQLIDTFEEGVAVNARNLGTVYVNDDGSYPEKYANSLQGRGLVNCYWCDPGAPVVWKATAKGIKLAKTLKAK